MFQKKRQLAEPFDEPPRTGYLTMLAAVAC
jgi:hypothetical protein